MERGLGNNEEVTDEPIWVVIHKCVEATLGISLYTYLYLKLAKMSYLLYFIYFSSTKLENKREEEFLPEGGGGR
jgi:hypothetical protein